MKSMLDTALEAILKTFNPEPVRFLLNGRLYLVDKVGTGWTWRNEDGDGQDDFGIMEPFPTAAAAQQSAIDFVTATGRAA